MEIDSTWITSIRWRYMAIAALAVRIILVYWTDIPRILEGRIELANSQTGIWAVREAAFLQARGVPIYDGCSSCQPSPFVVAAFQFVQRLGYERMLWVLLDMIAGLLVFRTMALLERRQRQHSKAKRKDDEDTELPGEDTVDYFPGFASFLYLFNPFTLAISVAQSSALFSTVASLAAVYFALGRRPLNALLAVSLAAFLSIYSITLAIPVCLLLSERWSARFGYYTLFLGFLGIWHGISAWSLGSFRYLYNTIGCNFLVFDLRPNIGLAWYLFVEMFDHFRSFFLTVFQLNQAVYIAPALIKFRSDPIMLAFVFTAIASTFRPYPTLADTVLLLVMLTFLGASLLRRSKILPVYCFALMAASLLGPINLHYWIQQGSGNANFYYAVVLLYNGANILLTVDVIRQWVLRDLQRMNPGISLDNAYQQ